MNVRFTMILAVLSAVMLAGCWDQRLLKEHSLVLAIGYDLTEDEKILKTVTYPKSNSGSGTRQNTIAVESKVLSMTGDTVKDAEKHMDQTIPEKFDRSKARIVMLGEQLASEGIFPQLDSIYRDLRGPLNAQLVVFDGKAKDGLSIKTGESMLISDVYYEILDSAEKEGITKTENVQSACPILLTEGKDLVLPYVGSKGNKEVRVKGTALFHGDRMTGTLNLKETTAFLILLDEPKGAGLNFKIRSGQKRLHQKNFVNMEVRKNKRKVKIHASKGHVAAKIMIDLQVEVDEYALDHLDEEKKVKALTKNIEDELRALAKKTLAKMQKANNDALGLGERVKAYHHSTWKQIDWDKVYPEMTIDPIFHVEIVRHGIIN